MLYFLSVLFVPVTSKYVVLFIGARFSGHHQVYVESFDGIIY